MNIYCSASTRIHSHLARRHLLLATIRDAPEANDYSSSCSDPCHPGLNFRGKTWLMLLCSYYRTRSCPYTDNHHVSFLWLRTLSRYLVPLGDHRLGSLAFSVCMTFQFLVEDEIPRALASARIHLIRLLQAQIPSIPASTKTPPRGGKLARAVFEKAT